MEVYLDNAATTRPSEAVLTAMRDAMAAHWHNPSALYRPAMEAEKLMDAARALCLGAVRAEGQRVIFTSGGTEADNLAILGYLRTVREPGRVLILPVEHPAVLSCVEEIERLGHRAELLRVGPDGLLDLADFERRLGPDVRMICIMQVNNEVGAVQPLREAAALRDRLCPEAVLHADGVQGFLRVPVLFNAWKLDSYAFSGHKIHGPKGVGGVIMSKRMKVHPLHFGGGQEGGLRSGTENTPGILGMAEAIRSFPADGAARMRALKLRLWEAIRAAVPEALVNGPAPDGDGAAPHILNISLPPVRSQTMLFALEGDGVYVSAGSACGSHSQKVSPILTAMGIPRGRADCALRFSLCPGMTEEQIDYAAASVAKEYRVLSKYVRR